jgi:hypothetical protein
MVLITQLEFNNNVTIMIIYLTTLLSLVILCQILLVTINTYNMHHWVIKYTFQIIIDS